MWQIYIIMLEIAEKQCINKKMFFVHLPHKTKES